MSTCQQETAYLHSYNDMVRASDVPYNRKILQIVCAVFFWCELSILLGFDSFTHVINTVDTHVHMYGHVFGIGVGTWEV